MNLLGKIFLGLAGIMTCSAASAADMSSWWMQSTVCQVNPAKCYGAMGAGYDTELWDVTSNCRGMKLICPDALTGSYSTPMPISKTEIAAGTGIDNDFDLNTYFAADDCYGVRKSTNGGSQVIVDGNYVKVWCPGVLNSPDEQVANGEIMLGGDPTCADLAAGGYVAVLNQNCYGKYFDPDEYYIECVANQLLPNKVVDINGADVDIGIMSSPLPYPTTQSLADTAFGTMQSDAATQRKSYFNQ